MYLKADNKLVFKFLEIHALIFDFGAIYSSKTSYIFIKLSWTFFYLKVVARPVGCTSAFN